MSDDSPDKTRNDFVIEEPNTGANAQLALSLFEEFVPKELKITDAPLEVGYNRANVFLDLLDLSLLGRRAIDVAYFIVAQSGTNNKYFSRHPKDEYVTYVVDLEFFKWLMGYASNNRSHLRSVLRQGQKAAIEIELDEPFFDHNNKNSHLDGDHEDNEPSNKASHREVTPTKGSRSTLDQWVSVPLLGPVGFNRGQVYFQVHKQLEPYIKNPSTFHFLDLRYIFETLRGRILYDRVQPFVDAGLTPWISVQDLRKSLDCTTKVYQEYKYFTARALNRAVEDINKNSDLNVQYQEMLEEGASRKVASVRFVIERTQRLSSAREHLDKLTERYKVLVDEFGLNAAQIMTISKNRKEWTEERLDQAIEYTRHQYKQGKVKITTAGYLMKALREHYVLGTAMIEIQKQKEQGTPSSGDSGQEKPPSTAKPSAPYSDELYKQSSEAGLRQYSQLDGDKQTELFDEFLRSPGARLSASGDQVKLEGITLELLLSGPLLRRDFGYFVYQRLNASTTQSTLGTTV